MTRGRVSQTAFCRESLVGMRGTRSQLVTAPREPGPTVAQGPVCATESGPPPLPRDTRALWLRRLTRFVAEPRREHNSFVRGGFIGQPRPIAHQLNDQAPWSLCIDPVRSTDGSAYLVVDLAKEANARTLPEPFDSRDECLPRRKQGGIHRDRRAAGWFPHSCVVCWCNPAPRCHACRCGSRSPVGRPRLRVPARRPKSSRRCHT